MEYADWLVIGWDFTVRTINGNGPFVYFSLSPSRSPEIQIAKQKSLRILAKAKKFLAKIIVQRRSPTDIIKDNEEYAHLPCEFYNPKERETSRRDRHAISESQKQIQGFIITSTTREVSIILRKQ